MQTRPKMGRCALRSTIAYISRPYAGMAVSADETLDGQTTVSRHRKPLAVTCSQDECSVVLLLQQNVYKITRNASFSAENTLIMLTPLYELHTGGRS